jgi:hypothetical protein
LRDRKRKVDARNPPKDVVSWGKKLPELPKDKIPM